QSRDARMRARGSGPARPSRNSNAPRSSFGSSVRLTQLSDDGPRDLSRSEANVWLGLAWRQVASTARHLTQPEQRPVCLPAIHELALRDQARELARRVSA